MRTASSEEVGSQLLNNADPTSLNTKILQLREIGIKIALQSLAENATSRLLKLNKQVELLEDELFSDVAIKNLTESGKIERYQLLLQAVGALSGQVKSNAGNTDWTGLEIRIDAIRKTLPAINEAADSTTDQKQLTAMASSLLNELSQLSDKSGG